MTKTIDEALQEGFEFCMEEGGEKLIKLIAVKSNPDYYLSPALFLCEKQPRHFTVSDNEIENLVTDHIDCNDEFASDDGLSPDALEGCDDLFKQLTDLINSNMAKKDFYFTTECILMVQKGASSE